MNVEKLSTGQYTTTGEEWPGYFPTTSLATAWRLYTISLPTGGKYIYTYDLDNVQYDL